MTTRSIAREDVELQHRVSAGLSLRLHKCRRTRLVQLLTLLLSSRTIVDHY